MFKKLVSMKDAVPCFLCNSLTCREGSFQDEHEEPGTAETIKKGLETAFPGADVILANYPPALPKRILSKTVLVF
ncbi:hypothetical protein IFM89_005867 [Coptis chinensis]|uniref:Uncharacterized protein n=1 Tax=Coptis chinensis TaxID=261450 RepID=A0A835LUT7_9MAGN|nr:hypothetical protein IFM89_005867 [Coptis chinensis]